MAFDGIYLSGIVNELNDTIIEGRINKVNQPESDEIWLTIKTADGLRKLIISSNPSLPIIRFTDESKTNPKTALTFNMLLRKHIQNGKIISISQPNFDRVIDITIEHMNEMGDLVSVHLIAEFMGKHSNIILCDDNYKILDSLKRVPLTVSSVREVLPGREYFIPGEKKLNPITCSKDEFINSVKGKKMTIYKAIYSSVTGFSPHISGEICDRAYVDPSMPANSCPPNEINKIYNSFNEIVNEIKSKQYFFATYLDRMSNKHEYCAIKLTSGFNMIKSYESPSTLLYEFYKEKAIRNRIHQKSSDLRQIANISLERSVKKLSVQEKQLKSTESMDKYKIYGELLQAFGYGIDESQKSITVKNYYDNNNELTIPLKEGLSPQENANEYFKRYNKLKRTKENVTTLIEETKNEIAQLESIINSLEISESEDDLSQIRAEMSERRLINKHISKNDKIKSKPLHFVSSDGFDIFVGKNNYQNEEVTFKIADSDDWWFHAKNIAGSHVIVKSGKQELPDRTFEEAGALAAHFSSGKNNEKVEIDYVKRREIRKPPKTNPGFVIYHTNYSLIADTDISNIKKIEE